MKSSFFSGLKWKIDTGSGAPTKEEVEREVAVLCLCPRPFPEAYFPKWRAAECSGNVLEGALFFLFLLFSDFYEFGALSISPPFALLLQIHFSYICIIENARSHIISVLPDAQRPALQ